MKKIYILTFAFLFPVGSLFSQISKVLDAGQDTTINCNGTATLVATMGCGSQLTTSYTVSAVPYNPDPYTVGTQITFNGNQDDYFSSVINIGFPFCFYGTSYTQLLVSSNNYLSFNLTYAGAYSPWPINAPIPSATPAEIRNSIMNPWQDIHPGNGGTVKYTTVGNAPYRRFIVSYYQIPMFSCTGSLYTSQVVLEETSNIIEVRIQSKPLCTTWNSGAAIQGLNNAAGTAAVVVPGRNYPTQWTTNNDGRRYCPSGANGYTTLTWYEGSTANPPIGTGTSISVSPTVTTTYIVQTTLTCNNTLLSDTVQVILNNSINVSAGPDTSICIGGQTTFNATGGTGYFWTPVTDLSNPNIPNPVANPTLTTTYLVTVIDAQGCTGTDEVILTVNLPPAATVTASSNLICIGSSTTLDAIGSPMFTWSPSSGLSATTGAQVIATPTITTTYTAVGTAPGCPGSAADMVVITVDPGPTITLNITNTTICAGQSTTLTASGANNYTWSPTAGLSTSSGATVTATPLVSTTYIVSGTTGPGCPGQAQVDIQVIPIPVVTVSPMNPSICSGQQVTLTASGASTYVWTPTVGLSSGTGIIVVANPSATQNYSVTGTVGMCSVVENFSVTVNPIPVVNIVGLQPNYCVTDPVVVLNGIPSGGTFRVNGVSSTALDPGTGAGIYNVVYTYSDINGCTDSSTYQVTVSNPPIVDFTGLPPTICTNSLPVTLNGNPANGVFTGNGISANIYDPGASGPGTHVITYTFSNGCVVSYSQSIDAFSPTPASFSGLPASICIDAADQALSATPTGGTFAGNGISGSTFSPAVAGPGNHMITYTYTDGNGCITLVYQQVIVNALPVLSFVNLPVSGCINDAPITLNAMPPGGTFTINSIPSTIFSPTTQGEGIHMVQYDYTDVNLCSNNISQNLEVFLLPVVSFTGLSTDYCVDALPSILTGSPSGGIFTGRGISGDIFNPLTATPGSYDIVYTYTDPVTTCTNFESQRVLVHSLPEASFIAKPSITTLVNPVVKFFDQSTGAARWAWDFADGSALSPVQNPVHTYQSQGTFEVLLTVYNINNCIDTATTTVIIRDDFTLFVPSAFSPNGDGVNDNFGAFGSGIYDYKMMIFDRWGSVVFESDDIARSWDGKSFPQGTYVYKIIAKDQDDFPHEYVGYISLIR